MSFEPTTEWFLALVPEISLAILLIAIQVYSRVLPSSRQRQVGIMTAWGAFVILLLTFGLWLFANVPGESADLSSTLMWGGMIRNDMVTLVFRVIFLFALMITALFSVDTPRLQAVEFYALLILATIGFSLMAASSDLIMVYVALETASVSSYILAGFFKNEDRSTEAGMKYFIYGAFATAVLLYGLSMIYGLTGQTGYYAIGSAVQQLPTPAEVLQTGDMQAFGILQDINGVLLIAAVAVVVGFGFKIAAVPYHFWSPDVYEGSPTAFTAFVSTASKAAGFAVFIRIFTAGVFGPPGENNTWWVMLVAMTIITMTIGNLAAIYQRNLKRMLAYSSIAQAGYAMIGLVTLTQSGSGATMFYLLMYVFTNIAAFGIIVLVSNVSKSDQLEDFYGLNRRSPWLAMTMMIALLSLSGIPPTAGFLGKFFLFQATVQAGYWWLAAWGLLNAFVALYYYLTIIKYMYLYDSDQEKITIPVSLAAKIGLGVSTLGILILGIFASPAYEWTLQAAGAFYTLAGG